MTVEITQNWLIMALLTPTLWAAGSLVDVCLVGQGVYRKAVDGVIIACLFGLLPITLVAILDPAALAEVMFDDGLPLSAFAAGIAFSFHLLFYFRALFQLNDVSSAETFLSMSVIVVPLFAWLILGEVLPGHFYLAFFIASCGVLLQSLSAIRRAGFKIAMNMLACVIAVSLSMVLQADALENAGFSKSTIGFNVAGLLFAAILLARSKLQRIRIAELYYRIPVLLIGVELLGILAILSSHRATEFAPSVTLPALIECLLPVIIVLLSYMLICINPYLRILSVAQIQTLSLQIQGIPLKMLAFSLLAVSLVGISL